MKLLKAVVIILEYLLKAAFFFPFLVGLIIYSLIRDVIDMIAEYEDKKNISSSERRAERKTDRTREKRKDYLNILFNYWKENIFH